MQRDYLFIPNKLAYVRGKNRPKVDCILCGVVAKDPQVDNLEIYRSDRFLVSINLYPYNPGHLIIFPIRHIEDPSELTDEEALELHHLQLRSLNVIRQEYPAAGFNIGYNLGAVGGGSIPHLHLHIVPRFRNEKGFMCTIAHTEIVVLNPHEMKASLSRAFANS